MNHINTMRNYVHRTTNERRWHWRQPLAAHMVAYAFCTSLQCRRLYCWLNIGFSSADMKGCGRYRQRCPITTCSYSYRYLPIVALLNQWTVPPMSTLSFSLFSEMALMVVDWEWLGLSMAMRMSLRVYTIQILNKWMTHLTFMNVQVFRMIQQCSRKP